jgi:hypothetical protein
MKKMTLRIALFVPLASVAIACQAASAQQQKPNILFILADNVGYGDVGAYGGGELRGAPTPRIDRFAAEGLRLTQFLVEPSCTPSRAAFMTGRYSVRSGLSLVAVEGTDISLPAREITIAEMLRDGRTSSRPNGASRCGRSNPTPKRCGAISTGSWSTTASTS